MVEELQSLLNRIQKDGVEKAETEAEKIVSTAEEKAKTIITEAEEKAKAILEKTDQDSKEFVERGEKSIEQSGRDVVLSIGDTLNTVLKNIASRKISQVINVDTLKQMLVKMIESYCKQEQRDSRIDILLNHKQQKEVVDFLMAEYGEAVRKGIEIKADSSIVSGFRVSVVNEEIEHDFSDEAITEALCQLLRPKLAEIVRDAMNTSNKSKIPQSGTIAPLARQGPNSPRRRRGLAPRMRGQKSKISQ